MRLLFVDRVLTLRRGETIETVLDLDDQDDLFRHHFPGNPMLPASALLESFAQTATILLETSGDFTRKAFPAYMTGARFPRPARPPAPLRLTMRVSQQSEDGAVLEGEARQDGARCATCTMGMVLAPLADFYPGAHLEDYRDLFRQWLAGAALEGFETHPLERLDHVRAG